MKKNRVEIILKVAERCNINCTYCYFFNGGDYSYVSHPAIIKEETIRRLAEFLFVGISTNNLHSIQIDFHGGEPLLLGKNRFSRYCEILHNRLSFIPQFNLCLQTNAMLVDEEWIEIFEKWKIKVGASLDGNREMHDKHRIDFRGSGTYDQTIKGVRLLNKAFTEKRIPSFGVLCVINPHHSSPEIYRHFVDELGIKSIDFLFPDQTHDTFDKAEIPLYKKYLKELMTEWTKDDNPEIYLRMLNSTFSVLLGGFSYVNGFGRNLAPAFTVASNGDIGSDDLLRVCGEDIINLQLNICRNSFAELTESRMVKALGQMHNSYHKNCNKCCWLNACGGGLLVNRFARRNNFKNPSVFCEVLKDHYSRASAYLLDSGVPVSAIRSSLGF